MVANKIYNILESGLTTFVSTIHISSKPKSAIWLQRISDGKWIQLGSLNYDLINNSIVTNDAIDNTVYKKLELRVADTEDELIQVPSDTAVVASMSNEVITVSGIGSGIVTVSGVSTKVSTVATDIEKGIGTNQVTDSAILNALTNANQTISDASTATTQAGIATTKAGEASTSATNALASGTSAELDKWITEADRMTTDSYATEPENVFVKSYVSDGDGTFTATDTTEYSALHWSAKAEASVQGTAANIAIVDTANKFTATNVETALLETRTIADNSVDKTTAQTIAGIKTFSSSPIIPTPTTGMQSATKKYVDDSSIAIATSAEIRTGTDNTKAVTPLGINETQLGWGQTWQNVTASRVLGVAYTNNTGKPIAVHIKGVTNITSGDINMTVDGHVITGSSGGGVNYGIYITVIIPSGSTYIGGGVTSPALQFWFELK